MLCAELRLSIKAKGGYHCKYILQCYAWLFTFDTYSLIKTFLISHKNYHMKILKNKIKKREKIAMTVFDIKQLSLSG